ncbi:MAG: transporter substrate-binding domain-containing protein [Alphaproteobacteria bacterium]|nr:transporter substrate-binding domain-containing protein [Alphaproteobacteria bacterium]
MRLFLFLAVVVLAVTAAFTAIKAFSAASLPRPNVQRETALDRVKRTGVLRCGYYVFPPVTMRESSGRTLSGLSIDMMEKIGTSAGLKIEWTEEVDFGTWPLGLKAGRFDAVCTPIWPDISLAREAAFTRPMFYAGINAYVRGDDHRFDNNLAAINNPNVTLSVIEGNATYYLAHANFRNARIQALPQNSPGGAPAENVITRKADIFFWDDNGAYDFLKSRPGSIRNVAPGRPIKVMPFELATDAGEGELRDFLDVALQNLEDSGATNLLLQKWERVPGSYYPLAKPYMVPASR